MSIPKANETDHAPRPTAFTRIFYWKTACPLVVLIICLAYVGWGVLLLLESTSKQGHEQPSFVNENNLQRPVTKSHVAASASKPSWNEPTDEHQCVWCNKKNHIEAAVPSLAGTMGLNGTIADCCCSFSELERANAYVIYPLLQKTVATPFFAHFKINFDDPCTLWDDQPVCMLRDCSVCTLDDPPVWTVAGDCNDDDADNDYDWADDYNTDDRIVTTVDWHIRNEWSSVAPLSFLDPINNNAVPVGMPIGNNDSTTATSSDTAVAVVDLRLNPERYTGYAGPSAAKVWSAIHLDNCFQQQQQNDDDDDHASSFDCSLPSDQRIYNRVISGMHSSISLHIAHSYCLEMDSHQSGECQTWGSNRKIAQIRVLNHRDRLENLYVAFALLLRAVQKAGPAIRAAVPQHNTTNDPNDALYVDSLVQWTDHLWPQLSRLAVSCPTPFDESTLLAGKYARSQLLRRFRHLQQIMRCVGCDRCKLWGTLQTLGIGTALKILLPSSSSTTNNDNGAHLILSRQEAVALVNTLERFSSAIVFANDLASSPTNQTQSPFMTQQ